MKTTDEVMSLEVGEEIVYHGKHYRVDGEPDEKPYLNRQAPSESWVEVPVVCPNGKETTIGVIDPEQVALVGEESNDAESRD